MQSGEETDVKRQHLNRALKSLSSLFRPKQGAWHKRIQLMKGFDFLSTRTTNSVRLIVGSQNSILEIEHFHTYSFQMRESHQTSPSALRAETSFRFQSDRQSSPTEGESDIRPLPVFFRSDFSDRRHNTGFRDKSIVFLHFSRKLRGCQPGMFSVNFDFRNDIFQPMVFPCVWAKYKWKFMRDSCRLSFLRPLAASPLACPERRAGSQVSIY